MNVRISCIRTFIQYVEPLVDESDNKILKDRQDGTGYELMKYKVVENRNLSGYRRIRRW